jgi:hypothetical protein
LVLLACAWVGSAAACIGDCNTDGSVTVDELVLSVNIALGNAAVIRCRSVDRNDDNAVTVDELVAAVVAALHGCPATPSATATPTITPPPTPNLPPLIPRLGVYRSFPGFEIRLPIGATDPEGGMVRCTAADLPVGAQLQESPGVLRWTPVNDQLGIFDLPFMCTDAAEPPASAEGRLVLRIAPLDACTDPSCDPASGCERALVPLTDSCCVGEPEVRIAEPPVGCPEGRALLIGRNSNGFGRMYNCDRLQGLTQVQSGTTIRLHVAASCMNAVRPVTLGTRIEGDSPNKRGN